MAAEEIVHLKPAEVAKDLAVSVDTLRRMRERGEGPPWIRVSDQSVRYPADQYEAWKDSNTKPGDLAES